MKNYNSYLPSVLLLLTAAFLLSCQQPQQSPGDVPIYTFPPREKQSGTPLQPDAPVLSSPPSSTPKEEYVERNIVVTERNSIFSIGIPAGSRETTEVIAQKPIDFWFEYLAAEAKLVVDGVEVPRNPFAWETKIKYTKSVTSFKYEITNATGSYISYNLHLVPAIAGESVAVVVRQRWIP